MDKIQFEDHISVRCERWLDILDELSVGAFTVNFKHRITAINYTAQALIGLRGNEVLGQDCREIFTGVPCMVSCIISPKKEKPSEESVVEVFDENHGRHLITRMATPIYDRDNKLLGCLTILQDHSPISDLIDRVHHEEKSLKHILNSIDTGIFTVNRGGLITFFNTAAERISGYHREDVLGRPCSIIFQEPEASDICLLEDSIADGGTRRSRKGRIIDHDGVPVPIRAKYMALKNEKGAIVGGLATFYDLTLVNQLNQAIRDRYIYNDMVGKSPAMQRIFEMIEVVAKSDATLLVEGATGTGKDLLAKVIHSSGNRAAKPFVKINCAALPETLLESELFGYVKGAFTGADKDKPGRFQEAEGGTIFLDEIGDMPLSIQAKLLRIIEDKEFYPLGSRRTSKANVRIISATNRGLEQLVKDGFFRKDLYYRLNVLRIELPSLIDRRADLPLLLRHVSRKLCAAQALPPQTIDREAMQILLNHDYPGNVRELENILEHAVIVSRGESIQPRHLPEYLFKKEASTASCAAPENPQAFQNPPKKIPVPKPATNAQLQKERTRIIQALEKTNWHRAKAARALGIDRTTLWRKMRRFKLME